MNPTRNGTNNVASATSSGSGADAYAVGGENNTAISTGAFTCAGDGDSNETAVNEDLCDGF